MYNHKNYKCLQHGKVLIHQCDRCFTRDGKIAGCMIKDVLYMFCSNCRSIVVEREIEKDFKESLLGKKHKLLVEIETIDNVLETL